MLKTLLKLTILLSSVRLAAPQYTRDYFVVTARLSCKIPEKHNFRYQIQYFENDIFTSDDKVTKFDNVGNGTDGEVMENNFGILLGDGFLNSLYELYAVILHGCTKLPEKMRKLRVELESCSTLKRNCRQNIRLDITEQGEEVPEIVIPDVKFSS